MKKKVYSIRTYLIAGWAIVSGLLLFVFFNYGAYTVWKSKDNVQKGNQILASHYAALLNKDIDSMENFVDHIYGENVQYQELKRGYLTENEWYKSVYYLGNNFESKAGTLDFFGGIFFYDENKNSMRSRYSDYEYNGDTYHLNLCIKEYLQNSVDVLEQQDFLTYDNEKYLIYIKGYKGKKVGYVLNLSRYFENEDQLSIVFYTENRLVEQGGIDLPEDEVMELVKTDGKALQHNPVYVLAQEDIRFADMKFAMLQKTESIWNLKENKEFWLFIILIPLILSIALWEILQIFQKMLILPVEHVAERLNGMKKTEDTAVSQKKHQTREILDINEKLDEMLEEMKHLQKEKYAKELEANHAKLQYYQLQVNPHFFINCLNVIDSLLGEETENAISAHSMICWLSRHFRYVFQDQENLVTIREELKEVEDYCNIYMVKGGMPISFTRNIEEAMKEVKVPILTIQTFVENSVKYAQKSGKILAIEVDVKEMQEENNTYVLIRIKDNGPGYQEDKIAELNQPIEKIHYTSQHVGIDNIRYRMKILYGDRAKIYFYNTLTHGAATEILLPVEEENQSENIDY